VKSAVYSICMLVFDKTAEAFEELTWKLKLVALGAYTVLWLGLIIGLWP